MPFFFVFSTLKFRPLGPWMYNLSTCGRTPPIQSRVRGILYTSGFWAYHHIPTANSYWLYPVGAEFPLQLMNVWCLGLLVRSGLGGEGDFGLFYKSASSTRDLKSPCPNNNFFFLIHRNEYLIFQKIIKLEYDFPEKFFPKARDLVEKLLVSILNFLGHSFERCGYSDYIVQYFLSYLIIFSFTFPVPNSWL